ncbi:MAG TPA: FAD-binding protein [Actinomycetaceae bacterium]|nr:FAD-binding protein [Actinomycetaceae bacterium]
MPEFDHLTDVVVVGSGAAAAATALAAKENGLEPLILESTKLFGGSSAISGGGLWVPNNHVMKRAGVTDSPEAARTYLDYCLDHTDHPAGAGEAASPARREAFLRSGPEMVKWLETLGFEWHYGKGYSDYYPQYPGGTAIGRGLEAKKFDLNRLGRWSEKLRHNVRGVALHTTDAAAMSTSRRSARSFLRSAKAIGIDSILPRLRGKNMVGLGNALMGRLLELLLDRTIPIWLDATVTELIVDDDGRVAGVVVERGHEAMRIGATRGVMIAAGGFEKNQGMRERFQEHPTEADWSSGAPGNLGGPIEIAAGAGAKLANMDSAWWGPTVMYPGEGPGFMLSERSLPHGIIVASDGKRFMNESEPYVDAGHHQYAKNREEGVTAIPAWHILDSHHRTYYPYGTSMPGLGTRQLVETGVLFEADSLEGLARKIGVDVAGLLGTVERFNGFVASGQDEDFGRGSNAHDHVYSDPRAKPNPNLGVIDRAPFYAAKVYPGDLGTSAGILTDEKGRALREDGSVVAGLYATGNSTASVMGYTYPGPGSTISAAMVFGYIAGRHMAARE